MGMQIQQNIQYIFRVETQEGLFHLASVMTKSAGSV